MPVQGACQIPKGAVLQKLELGGIGVFRAGSDGCQTDDSRMAPGPYGFNETAVLVRPKIEVRWAVVQARGQHVVHTQHNYDDFCPGIQRFPDFNVFNVEEHRLGTASLLMDEPGVNR